MAGAGQAIQVENSLCNLISLPSCLVPLHTHLVVTWLRLPVLEVLLVVAHVEPSAERYRRLQDVAEVTSRSPGPTALSPSLLASQSDAPSMLHLRLRSQWAGSRRPLDTCPQMLVFRRCDPASVPGVGVRQGVPLGGEESPGPGSKVRVPGRVPWLSAGCHGSQCARATAAAPAIAMVSRACARLRCEVLTPAPRTVTTRRRGL